MDATLAKQNIALPTNLKLLNAEREKIDYLFFSNISIV